MKQRTRAVPNRLMRQQREKRHWTQTELARMLGTTYLSVCRWENGTTTPSLYYRKQLCEIFQLSAEELGLASHSVETIRESEPEQPSSSATTVWNVPYRRNPFFTGRDYFLARLQALLSSSRAAALSRAQAISGLGGIGKTQTAVEYAYRYRNDYQAVLWARAEHRDVLYTDLVAIAALLNLLEQDAQDATSAIKALKGWLGTHTGWLLILDNVEDLSLIDEVMPVEAQGHLLLTTRAQSTGMLAQRLDLEEMHQEEGALFLLRRAKLLGPDAPLEAAQETIAQQASEICVLLGGLPLALDQAGAYIEETGCSLADYLAHYRAHRSILLKRRGKSSQEHPASVSTTVDLCVEKVLAVNPAALELLRLCAFLAPDAIPEEIFSDGAPELGPLFAPLATDPVAFNVAFAELRAYSLMRRNPDNKLLSIHRLVQATLKDAMDEQEQRQVAERCVRAVRRMFPEHDVNFWSASQRLLPQAQVCAALVAQWHMTFREAGQLLSLTGYYLMQQGQYQEAESLMRQALLLIEQGAGREHPETATCLNRLGELYWHESKYEQAASVRERALAIWEKDRGPEHPEVASGLNDLALVYRSQGRSDLAEPLFLRAYRIYEQVAKERELSPALCDGMAACAMNLAILYIEGGRFSQAEPLMLQSVSLSEQVWGSHHPTTTFAYHNLGYLYEWQGQYAQAEQFYRKALAVREEQLGGEHPDTAATLHNLGRVYQRQANYALSQTLFQRALAAREKRLGSEHARVAHTLSQLGSLFYDQGKYDQAEPALLRALTIRKQALGPDHPEVAWDLETLAQVYEAQDRYSEAEPLVQQALAIYEQQLGADHLDSVESLVVAGVLCFKQGRYPEARQFLERALAICERLLGLDHPKTATSLLRLAELYRLQGRDSEASQFLQRALAIREQQLGTMHPDTIAARESYTALLGNR